ncbi:MAG: hypothetical protein INH37_09825, partial [Myxococcaceae bacterium]|nr:hypothetical protein [Myxococcaceae bacterium]
MKPLLLALVVAATPGAAQPTTLKAFLDACDQQNVDGRVSREQRRRAEA